MLFKQGFWKFLVVCLKMLFRKSTRKRFICLVAAFLLTMGFNTHSYIKKSRDSENRRVEVMEENAFKVFFIRLRTKNDYAVFKKRNGKTFDRLEVVTINRGFIYQNNLFIQFFSIPETGTEQLPDPATQGIYLLYHTFGIEKAVGNFLVENDPDKYTLTINNEYTDYNGKGLDRDIVDSRHAALKGDLTDAADMIRGNLTGKRLGIFNDLIRRITSSLSRVTPLKSQKMNPYLSRVDLIVPLNLFHVFKNIANDNSTDILDYAESVKSGENATLEIEKVYMQFPETYRTALMHGDIDLYPRYIPLYAPNLLKPRRHWLLYEDIDINTAFMDTVDRLHFEGNYLFSYEKLLIIKERVEKINADILTNHIDFYLTDLSLGIVFPFMISLFSFIHLKAELAFLLMFKNRIRELLAGFWLLPLLMMLLVKAGMMFLFLPSLTLEGLASFGARSMILPMAVSFLIAAIAFYPINRWCFSQFTGEYLNLSVLHKGR